MLIIWLFNKEKYQVININYKNRKVTNRKSRIGNKFIVNFKIMLMLHFFIINIMKYSSQKPLLSKYNNFIKLFKKNDNNDFIQILDHYILS